MAKRIGILTGGGDCPGLNAAIRAVVKHATTTHGWQILGIEDAFKGLVEERYIELSPAKVRGILDRGGTILGSSNRAYPFAYPVMVDGVETAQDVSGQVLENLAKLKLEGLIVVGGDGTMGIAHKLSESGTRMVGIPKTIDNDLEATDYTIGFQTAVDVATEAIDRLHSTAESHDRIIICEVMGRYAGWIAMNSGMASGADVILIPEMEYDIERVVTSLQSRHQGGKSYSIVVVAEGALPKGGDHAVLEDGGELAQDRLGGAGQRLAAALGERTQFDIRVTVLGHTQRGGTPCAFDRLLATRFGVAAVDMIARGENRTVASLKGSKIVSVSMELAAEKLKRVEAKGDLVAAAKSLGIEMGA